MVHNGAHRHHRQPDDRPLRSSRLSNPGLGRLLCVRQRHFYSNWPSTGSTQREDRELRLLYEQVLRPHAPQRGAISIVFWSAAFAGALHYTTQTRPLSRIEAADSVPDRLRVGMCENVLWARKQQSGEASS